jgi:hypothetical protein
MSNTSATTKAVKPTSSSTENRDNKKASGDDPLHEQYPVNSVVELTLSNGETVRGLVYCTDEVSSMVVLKKSLVHTTLSSEMRLVNAACIESKKVVHAVAPDKPTATNTRNSEGEVAEELAMPLPNIHKKVLEEREKRALKLAEERFRHINEKVRAMLMCVCVWNASLSFSAALTNRYIYSLFSTGHSSGTSRV